MTEPNSKVAGHYSAWKTNSADRAGLRRILRTVS
jgi:hypothetical protein